MILEAALTALSFVVLGFGSDPPKAPPAPTPPPDTQAEDARARALAGAQRRRGRRSTMLTRPGTSYGLAGMDGPAAYGSGTNTKLGGGG